MGKSKSVVLFYSYFECLGFKRGIVGFEGTLVVQVNLGLPSSHPLEFEAFNAACTDHTRTGRCVASDQLEQALVESDLPGVPGRRVGADIDGKANPDRYSNPLRSVSEFE